MSKLVKKLEIEALRDRLGDTDNFIIIEPLAPDASADYNFRTALSEKNIQAHVVKNSYAARIFAEKGIQADVWSGQTMLCWGGPNVKALSKTIDEQIKASRKDPKSPERYKVKAAVADKEVISFEMAKKIPTREEALGTLMSAILGPASTLLGAITGPGKKIVGIVKTIEEKHGEAAPAAE